MTPSERKHASDFDWAAVRAALAPPTDAKADWFSYSPERAKAVLDARAEALARRPVLAAIPGTRLDVVSFALDKERYAIETRYVREVIRLTRLIRVPGTPHYFAGVTNLRGNVTSIVDIRFFFRGEGEVQTDPSRAIVLGGTRPEFGILADEVYGQSELIDGELYLPPGALPETGRDLVKGVTKAAEVLLDGAALLDDPRLTFGE